MDSDSSKKTEQDVLYDEKIYIKNELSEDSAQFHLKIAGNKITAARIIGSFDNYRKYNETLRNSSWENGVNISLENVTQYPNHLQIAYVLTFEKLMKNTLTVPIRAKYLRTIILELERISCHLSVISALGIGISYPFLSSKANSIRKIILDTIAVLFSCNEEKSYITYGGVTKDFVNNEVKKLNADLGIIEKDSLKLRKIFHRNSILKGLLQDVGFLSRDTAKKLSLVGPFARSSGLTVDVRKTDPYAAYGSIQFNIPVYDSCDLYGEIMVRLDEIIESLFIMKQLLRNLPEGGIIQELNLKEIPANNSTTRIETPSGELLSFALSKKGFFTEKPVNYQIISPIKINIQGNLTRMSGESFDNLSAILLFIGEGWSIFL